MITLVEHGVSSTIGDRASAARAWLFDSFDSLSVLHDAVRCPCRGTQIKLFEQRKNRATVMCDREANKCTELRRRIDELRKDNMSQHERFGTVRATALADLRQCPSSSHLT